MEALQYVKDFIGAGGRKKIQMKAIVYTQYGSPDVLQLEEVEKPVPEDDEVLVKVHAASVNAVDRHLMRSRPLMIRVMSHNGLLKPKNQRLGVDLAGRVEAVGSKVTQFQPGDEVFGRAPGAFAEYVCTREDAIMLKSARMSFEAAAAVPQGGVIALGSLRDSGQVRPGQHILINGASGAIGTFAVQIAKALGAEVTAVCSTRNVAMACSLGADHVIDYTREDFTRNGQLYDIILGVNGYRSILAYRRALRPGGAYVMVGASNNRLFRALLQVMLLGPLISRISGRKMILYTAKPTRQDLAFVKDLLEAGKLVPVVERCYPLSKTAEALRYLEKGHARGKLVISVDCDNDGCSAQCPK
jgi:NADPH:quinone reductase-like Zn-dependent oxidoreductase